MVLDIEHGICMNNKIEELEAQLAEQKALVKALEASLEAEQEAGRRLREEYGTGLREAAERQREACKLTAISYAKTQELISKEKLEDAPGSATMHAIESMMAERVASAIGKTPLVADYIAQDLPACKNCGRVMLAGKCCGKPDYT